MTYLIGWRGFVILMGFVFCSEAFSLLYGGDFGAFSLVTFHFIINPIYCSVFIFLTLLRSKNFKSKAECLLNLLCIVPAIGYIYIVITGNMHWFDIYPWTFN